MLEKLMNMLKKSYHLVTGTSSDRNSNKTQVQEAYRAIKRMRQEAIGAVEDCHESQMQELDKTMTILVRDL